MPKVNYKQQVLGLVIFALFFGGSFAYVAAQSVDLDEIEDEINDRSERIQELEDEIGEYQGELESTQSEAQTLEQAVDSFDSSIQRISSNIRQTSSEVNQTQATIAQLDSSIRETEAGIAENKDAIGETIRRLERAGNQSLVEVALSADSLSEALNVTAQLERVQQRIGTRLDELRVSREELAAQKTASQERKQELAQLRASQSDQQAILENQQNEKEALLAETNQEAGRYQSIIAQKRAQKEQFEAQLREFEAQLESTANQGGYAEDGQIFSWPVSSVVITQQFGGTEFAQQNPAAYGRPFHNGTDFGVPVGTPVMAVAGGTVRATGNTDAVPGCYSYGKWVLLDHDNGLSTLYAHLSRRSVSAGQSIGAGERIAYSGNTGYSTGPHLHLTTYIQDDVQIRDLGDVKQSTNCGGAQMPVAPLDSYINSMQYLP